MRALVLLLPFILSSCTRSAPEDRIIFAVASNAVLVANQLASQYESQTGTQVEVIIGSSGKLSTQIMQGAPFDVFLAADNSYSEALVSQNKTESAPEICAYGVPVIWCKKKSLDLNDSIRNEQIVLALPNPETAPFGRAALEFLKYHSLENASWISKVYTENASQVLTYVQEGHADCGCTSKSFFFEGEPEQKGFFMELDQKSYEPLPQMLVLVSASATAQDFYDFVMSEENAELFKRNGYRSVRD